MHSHTMHRKLRPMRVRCTALTLLLATMISTAVSQRITPYTEFASPVKFAATTAFQACTWDRDTQKCTMFIRLGMFLSKRADMNGWPGQTWGLAGKYVWGCSYEDNRANCEIQTRWNNCEWDPTMNTCRVGGAYTQSVMTSHTFLCADAKVSDFLLCSMQRKDADCRDLFGCKVSNATGMDGKPMRCVPEWYSKLDSKSASDFQAQFADTSSGIWDGCPYAKVVKSYKDTCYDYSNPVMCNEDSVCYWSLSSGNCVPKDWAMATIVWGGDYKAARTSLSLANQCRELKDQGTCLSKTVKIAPTVKYAPPPRQAVTNLAAIITESTQGAQAAGAKTDTPKALAGDTTTVSKAAGLNAGATKVQNASSFGSQQMLTYNQMLAKGGTSANTSSMSMLGNSPSGKASNGAAGVAGQGLLGVLLAVLAAALAAIC